MPILACSKAGIFAALFPMELGSDLHLPTLVFYTISTLVSIGAKTPSVIKLQSPNMYVACSIADQCVSFQAIVVHAS